jgi:predicted naringenin-chalcone synthase
MSFITATGIAVPSFRFKQSEIASFMEKTMGSDPNTIRKIKAVFRSSGIHFRHSVIADYGSVTNFSFYPNDESGSYPSTQRRMELFREHALPLSVAAVKDLQNKADRRLNDITHLIVVSCTGMYAPGLDIDLVKALKLSPSTHRTSIQFMGCYAAFNALKVADAFCKASPDSRVLIVCTELCSIHFQQIPTDDNILANALFADGSGAMIVESVPSSTVSLEIKAFHNALALNGETDMAWHIGDTGFRMNLSSYVPDLIRGSIHELVDKLFAKTSKGISKTKYYAIHPGGNKILQAIEDALQLSEGDNEVAYSILRQYGNLSSATVVFVLNELVKRFSPDDNGEEILSMGFGPGLTLESMLLSISSR